MISRSLIFLRQPRLSLAHLKNSSTKPQESFIVNAFAGKPALENMFPYPRVLSQDEWELTESMVDPVNKFFRDDISADENDRRGEITKEIRSKLAELGFYGLITPAQFGGLGLNSTQTAQLSELVGHFDLALMIHIGAHQSIGYRGIINYGNDHQKAKYLPDLASGRKIAAYCLTEPSAGSDAASIASKAVLSPDGRHYVLNGSKIWITNGGMADIMTVFAKTPVGSEMKMTAFIVERDFGGVSSGKPVEKMGIRASETCEVFFDDVHIPIENVLGEVGKGFSIAVNILNMGRSSICASMCGTMKEMLAKSIKFACERSQFGAKIVEYGVIREKLARMAMKIYSSESIGYLLAGNYDRKIQNQQVEAAICKIYGSDSAWSVVDDAIQIHGGMGYMRETELERVARDVRICRIFEGTNEILRLFVALNGFQFSGKILADLAKNPLKLAGNVMGKFVNSFEPEVKKFVHKDLAESAGNLSKSLYIFSKMTSSLLLKHKKGIKDRQFELFRVGEAAISLHVMCAVLSRASSSIERRLTTVEHEKELCRAICAEESENVSRLVNVVGEAGVTWKSLDAIAAEVVKNGQYLADSPIKA